MDICSDDSVTLVTVQVSDPPFSAVVIAFILGVNSATDRVHNDKGGFLCTRFICARVDVANTKIIVKNTSIICLVFTTFSFVAILLRLTLTHRGERMIL